MSREKERKREREREREREGGGERERVITKPFIITSGKFLYQDYNRKSKSTEMSRNAGRIVQIALANISETFQRAVIYH